MDLLRLPVSLSRRIFKRLGYTLSKDAKTIIIPNYFNTSHTKTALLSYIRFVFEKGYVHDERHTNRYTTFIIAEALSRLGYNVDIINYSDHFSGDINKYDVVLGLGNPLEYALQNRESKKTKVIAFGTGCNPFFSNVITISRIVDFYKRSNQLLLSSSRYIREDQPLQHEIADWIILHGSTFARTTYRPDHINSIHAPVFIKKAATRTNEEWNVAKKNYIWFGSDGAIHKGLDLVIEAFAKTPDCNLYICGNLDSEKEFMDYYNPVISSHPNITYQGFVNIDSDLFQEITRKCAFVIYPSASEGNSPAVITCMANGGMIPIVTKNADVDLNGFGVLIHDFTVDAVVDSIKKSQILSLEELKTQSEKIIAETHHLNAFDFFKTDFKQKLEDALKAIS